MSRNKKNERVYLFIPLVLITFGLSWMLTSLGTISLIMAILLDFVFLALLDVFINDINKRTIISAPMLIYFGFAVYVSYREWLPDNKGVLFAGGMIIWGLLMILARHEDIPEANDSVTRFLDDKRLCQDEESIRNGKKYLIVERKFSDGQHNHQDS